jgi:hypothetical protein
VWCGVCYTKEESDRFHVNELKDEDGNPMYDCVSDKERFKAGIDGAHLIIPFQCDLCIFRVLYRRNPRSDLSDKENLGVIRRMNLDAIWSREPSTIDKNISSLSRLVSTCEMSGFTPQLPKMGLYPSKDCFGYGLAFSMLMHSRNPGRHSKLYTQFATIRKQRSAFSNLYMASKEAAELGVAVSQGSQPNAIFTTCPSNSFWFSRWSTGCETRMGFILKQNKAISLDLLVKLIQQFKKNILEAKKTSWEKHFLCMGLVYSVIMFHASLRGSEGLQVDAEGLVKYLDNGKKRAGGIPEHVIIPIKGRFKGEKGERCHLLPLASVTRSGINIRKCVNLLLASRKEMNVTSPWAFADREGNKMSFGQMNVLVLERLEEIQEEDERDEMKLKDVDVREDYNINRSFRRGSATHAQNSKVPELVIEAQNRWRKFERAKGSRPKLTMIETYADVEQLIPTLVRYSAML